MSEDRENGQSENAAADQPGQEVLSEFFANFSGGGYKFIIFRKDPKTFVLGGQLRRVGGHMETLETPPTPDYLSEVWGGGIFEIKVCGPGKDGRPKFITSRTVEVAGDPKLKPGSIVQSAQPVDSGDPSLVHRVIDMSREDKKLAEARLEAERHRTESERRHAERSGASDPSLWHTTFGAIQASTESMVVTLREQLARRDAELAELRRDIHSRPPSTDTEILKLLERRAADDATRMIETHRRELEAERREHEQTVAMIERLHRSEIDNLKTSYDQQITNLRASNEQAFAGKEREIARLEAELQHARERGVPGDALSEMEKVSKLLIVARNLVPLANGEEAPTLIEKIFTRTEPLLHKVVENLTTPRPAFTLAPMRVPARQALPPRQAPQLRVIQGVGVESAAVPSEQKAEPAQTTDAAVGMPMKQGIDFLESAVRSGTPATNVAQTALSLLPKAGLAELAKNEPAAVLADIERVFGPDSILLTIPGRKFVGEFIEALRQQLAG